MGQASLNRINWQPQNSKQLRKKVLTQFNLLTKTAILPVQLLSKVNLVNKLKALQTISSYKKSKLQLN